MVPQVGDFSLSPHSCATYVDVTAVVDQSVDRHQVLASGRQRGEDQMTRVGKVVARMGRKALMSLPAVVLVAGTGALLPLGTAVADASPMHARNTLTVATTGSDSGNCQSGPCKTLGYALTQASPNDAIVIGPGTYPESDNANVVNPGLTGLSIRSTGSAARTVIDATGSANGILVEASGVSITGLTVENANLEGILAEPPLSSWPKGPTSAPANISHVTIARNARRPNAPAA